MDIKLYLQELNKIELLSLAEEKALGKVSLRRKPSRQT